MGTVAPAEPPFSSVAIVGLGLIGGSIALGLRQAWPSMPVVGVDRPDVIAEACRREAITADRPRLEDLGDVGLIVLAAPVPGILRLIADAARAGLDALVTDVGSTKRHIVAAADAAALRFIGGHPIAGAARAGLGHARADLFTRREWMIVPAAGRDADMEALERLVRGLGATPHRTTADAHDRLMAYVSHLPQLLATTLMTTAGGAVGKEGLSAAGPGFADMTRLASSPVEIWNGIFASNADYIAEALRALAASLPLRDGELVDAAHLESLFRDAQKWAARD
jgi:prephenate dehydrogenase